LLARHLDQGPARSYPVSERPPAAEIAAPFALVDKQVNDMAGRTRRNKRNGPNARGETRGLAAEAETIEAPPLR